MTGHEASVTAQIGTLVTALCRVRHLSHVPGHKRGRGTDSTVEEINRLCNEALAEYETPGHWYDPRLAESRHRPLTRQEIDQFTAYRKLWEDYKAQEKRMAELEAELEALKAGGVQ